MPVVSHEIAEYPVYPDFSEIPKYTGVLRARNFEILPGSGWRSNDMLPSGRRRSCRPPASCWCSVTARISRRRFARRSFAGFQLLDFQDFPGQGTALVGILNAFMESKGLITPA